MKSHDSIVKDQKSTYINKLKYECGISALNKSKLNELIAKDESKKALNDIFKQILEDYKDYKKDVEQLLEEYYKNINNYIHNSFKSRVNTRKKILNIQLNDSSIQEKIDTISILEKKYYEENYNNNVKKK